MESCRAWKREAWRVSESKLRETVMSTMEPEEMFGGRRMDGNSIWGELSVLVRDGIELDCAQMLSWYVPDVCLELRGPRHRRRPCRRLMRLTL